MGSLITIYFYAHNPGGGTLLPDTVFIIPFKIFGFYSSFEPDDSPPYEDTPWNSLSQPICGVTDITAKVMQEPDEVSQLPMGNNASSRDTTRAQIAVHAI